MVLVAQVGARLPARHRRGIGIGRADAEVGRASVGTARYVPVGTTGAARSSHGGGAARSANSARASVRQRNRQPRRASSPPSPLVLASASHRLVVSVCGEEVGEVRLDGEAGAERIQGGVGLDLGRVKVQLLAPDQPGRDALLDDRLEEAAEDVQPIALPDAAQTGVVGQRLGQVVAEIPAQAQPVGDDPHELPLGAQPLEEQHQLQLEEDDRVDGGRPVVGIGSRTRSRTKARSSVRSR